jgi:hypothetical protein
MLLSTLSLIASIAAPVASPCMADDSNVAIRGVVKEVNNRDRRTGQPYSYFIVEVLKPTVSSARMWMNVVQRQRGPSLSSRTPMISRQASSAVTLAVPSPSLANSLLPMAEAPS